jgi:hypothetical protein
VKTARGRGSFIRNVTYEDIVMSNVLNGITIQAYYPSDTPASPINHSNTPLVEDIRIRRVNGQNIGTALNLAGLSESPMRNVQIGDPQLSAAKIGECNPWVLVAATNVSIQAELNSGNCSLGRS